MIGRPWFLVWWIASASLVILFVTPQVQASGDVRHVVQPGEKVPLGSSLRDLRGNRRPLRSFRGNKALVLLFLGTDCPMANRYLPVLNELAEQYYTRGVLFLGIYPNAFEDLDMIASDVADHDIPFPVLKDVGQRLTDALGVQRTPTAVVIDDRWKLRYRGRIDDSLGVAFARGKPTAADLKAAIEAVLRGEQPDPAETVADGCLIVQDTPIRVNRELTYSRDVAPILRRRCQPCHRQGQVAPFALETFRDAVRWARMIREVVLQRRMPPWHADPRFGKFRNDRRMSWEEVETVVAWIDSGMPKGDDVPPQPQQQNAQEWMIGKPDLILELPVAFRVPPTGVLPYKYFVVDPGFERDVWVKAAEVKPGAREVVHHVIVHILRPGKRLYERDGQIAALVAWAPGDDPLICPDGIGIRVPAGAKLVFEMHYTPSGKAAVDRTKVGIKLYRTRPRKELRQNLFANTRIRIPAEAMNHRETATFVFDRDARIVSLFPHMHWRGKRFLYEVIYPDGREEVLLSVPRWDFNWQTNYIFAKPLHVPAGTRIRATAWWDNSRYNPYNPDPGKDVKWGIQTWDEMLVGWISYVYEDAQVASKEQTEPVE